MRDDETRPRCILTTFSQLRVLGCAMAASNLSRSAEDRNDRAALLAPDLERKAEELKHQLQTTVQSEINLLRKLMASKKMDAENFRARTQGSWEMIGVVSALFLTMDRYNELLHCDEESLVGGVPFCEQIHPFLAGTATLFAACSVAMSMILYIQMTFVPDEFLRDWMSNLAWSVEIPNRCFILSVSSWALDLLWQGVIHHGTFGLAFSVLVLVPALLIVLFYLRTKNLTNNYLMMAAAAAEQEGH